MAQKEETYIYATAANGIEVRIPASSYDSWAAEQEKIRQGKSQPDQKMLEQLRSILKKKK